MAATTNTKNGGLQLAQNSQEMEASRIATNELVNNVPKQVLLVPARNKTDLRRIYQWRLGIESVLDLLETHSYDDNGDEYHKVFPVRVAAGIPATERIQKILEESDLDGLNDAPENVIGVANLSYALSHKDNIDSGVHDVSVLGSFRDEAKYEDHKFISQLFNKLTFDYEKKTIHFDQKEQTISYTGFSKNDTNKWFTLNVPLDHDAYTYHEGLLKHTHVVSPHEGDINAVKLTMRVYPVFTNATIQYYAMAVFLHDILNEQLKKNPKQLYNGDYEHWVRRLYQNLLDVRKNRVEFKDEPTLYENISPLNNALQKKLDKSDRKLTNEEVDAVLTFVVKQYENFFLVIPTSKRLNVTNATWTYVICSEMGNALFFSHLFPFVCTTFLAKLGRYARMGNDELDAFQIYNTLEDNFEKVQKKQDDDDEPDTFKPGYLPAQIVITEPVSPLTMNELVKLDASSNLMTYNHAVIESLVVQLCFGLMSPQHLFHFHHHGMNIQSIGYQKVESDGEALYYQCFPVYGTKRGDKDQATYVRIPLPLGGYRFFIRSLGKATTNIDVHKKKKKPTVIEKLLKTRDNDEEDDDVEYEERSVKEVADSILGQYKEANKKMLIVDKNNKDFQEFASSLVDGLTKMGVAFPDSTVAEQLPYLHVLAFMLGPDKNPFPDKKYPKWFSTLEDEKKLLGRTDAQAFAAYLMDKGYALPEGRQGVPSGTFLYKAFFLKKDF